VRIKTINISQVRQYGVTHVDIIIIIIIIIIVVVVVVVIILNLFKIPKSIKNNYLEKERNGMTVNTGSQLRRNCRATKLN